MINRIVLVGRTTADIELRYTQSGVPVCSFSLAVERNFKNAQGEKVTDFINCTAWRKTAELISQYVKKGNMLGVEGSLQQRNYEKDGQKRTAYEVQVDGMQFLSSGGSQGHGENTQDKGGVVPKDHGGMDHNMPEDSDIPF